MVVEEEMRSDTNRPDTLLMRRIYEAYRSMGWEFLCIAGKQGCGKSTLGLQLLDAFYHDYDVALNHTIFTMEELIERLTENPDPHFREGMLFWDDAAVYASKYTATYNDPVSAEFFEMFNAIRPRLAVLLVSVVRPDDLPRALRTKYTGLLDIKRRGVFDYQIFSWMPNFKRPTEVLQKMILADPDNIFHPLPLDIYERYERRRNEYLLNVKAEKLRLTEEESIISRLREKDVELLRIMVEKFKVSRPVFSGTLKPYRSSLHRLQYFGLLKSVMDGKTENIVLETKGEYILDLIREREKEN